MFFSRSGVPTVSIRTMQEIDDEITSDDPWNPWTRAESPYYPPVFLHKVYMLNCGNCGKFITNRSMKCRLLQRVDVLLFSSDTMPINCSVYQDYTNTPRNRTCECLSQTLCCHGCGTAIGYMIVSPCTHCATGIGCTTPYPNSHSPLHNTDGHRFVFYASDVSYEERLHVAGDPDVTGNALSQEVFEYEMRSMHHSLMSQIPRIRPGEYLYWHHFVPSDNMTTVHDDNRARASRGYRFDPVNGIYPNRIMAGR